MQVLLDDLQRFTAWLGPHVPEIGEGRALIRETRTQRTVVELLPCVAPDDSIAPLSGITKTARHS